MNELITNDETLVIDCRINLEDFKVFWFDSFKAALPNTFLFWGALFFGSLALAFVLKNSPLAFLIFLILALLMIAIPVLVFLFSYQNFISVQKKYISKLSDSEKNYSLIFKFDSEGFESVNDKNFSHMPRAKIENVVEKNKYFSLLFNSQPIIIMKKEFKREDEINWFRSLLLNNLGNKVKFLRPID